VQRVARIGALPTDSPDEALRKRTLVLFTSFTALVSFVWVGTYWALGLYLSAAIPFAYQVVCVGNLVVFAKTKRYRFFRTSQLALGLVLPFLLQLSLGGFLPSSGIVLWSFTAPLGALLFSSRRDATRWFLAFLGVIGLGWRTRSRGSVTCRSPISNVRRSRSRHGELRFPSACATPRRQRCVRPSARLSHGS